MPGGARVHRQDSTDSRDSPAFTPTDRDLLADIDLVGTVMTALDAMAPSRYADVLRGRLGIGDTPQKTLQQIGDVLGISRERVRQVEVKALPALRREVNRSSTGEDLLPRLTSSIRPDAPPIDSRVADAAQLLCPDWPARLARRIVMVFVGMKPKAVRDAVKESGARPSHVDADDAAHADEARVHADGSLHAAVASRFGGIEVVGQWKRFDGGDWFHVGQSVAECPVCGLVLEGFRRPYLTSGGGRYHYWALVCLKCRRAWAPADLDEDGRHDVYGTSEHRPAQPA